jgi:hypothetical protein
MSKREWIEWHGGKCPVAPTATVDVRFPNGTEMLGYPASDWISGANDWWQHQSVDHDNHIIAYRVVSS